MLFKIPAMHSKLVANPTLYCDIWEDGWSQGLTETSEGKDKDNAEPRGSIRLYGTCFTCSQSWVQTQISLSYTTLVIEGYPQNTTLSHPLSPRCG